MNSKTTILVAATAALLTAASVTAASAQTQERNSTRMNAGQNLSTGGQMNAQGPGMNTGQQIQGRNLSRNEGTISGRNELRGTNRSARLTNQSSLRDRDRNRSAFYGPD